MKLLSFWTSASCRAPRGPDVSFLCTLMSLSDTPSLSARPHRIPLGAEVLLAQQHFPDVLLCAGLQRYKQVSSLSPQACGLAVENAAARKGVHGQLSCCSGRVGCGKTCSQAGEGTLPEGVRWEQHALHALQWVLR